LLFAAANPVNDYRTKGDRMRLTNRQPGTGMPSIFPQQRIAFLLILALASWPGLAQEEPAPVGEQAEEEPVTPGLYVTVDEHSVYIIQDEQQVDINAGETAFASEALVESMESTPGFMNWPCGGSIGGQEALETYSIGDLAPGARISQVARRFFEEQQVLVPEVRWSGGEFHTHLSGAEIDEYVTYSRWYSTGEALPDMAAKRPDTLLIGVFYSTAQVIIDTNHLDHLKAVHGNAGIPVVFEFHAEHEVPISFFGSEPDFEAIAKAYAERGLMLSKVPMWYAGDRHLEMSPGDLSRLLGLESPESMDPARLAELQQGLQNGGFLLKPISLFLMPAGGKTIADEPDKIIAAQSLGLETIPVTLSFFEAALPTARCGLPVMLDAAGAAGQSSGSTATSAPGSPPAVDVPPSVEPPVSAG
jgi:hypothetical protein